MSYHKITVVGNLGRDPEMRYTADFGRQVRLLKSAIE